jgi:hypothetical protein
MGAARRDASEALAELERREVASTAGVHRKVTRAASLFAVALACVVFLGAHAAQWVEPKDLAKGKPWRASSALFQCYPDRLDCGGTRTSIFFHTQQENEPWVVIDLQAPTSFSSVSVVNRRDAAKERAVPLALEVSDDEKTWRLLARRDEDFSAWRPRFEATTARYVRLKALRNTYLHLDAVKVHP